MAENRALVACFFLSVFLHLVALAVVPELREEVRKLPVIQKLSKTPIEFVKIIIPKPKPKPKPKVVAQRPRRVVRRVRRIRRIVRRRIVQRPKPPEQPKHQEPTEHQEAPEPIPIAEIAPPPKTEEEKPANLPPPVHEVKPTPAPEPKREELAALPKQRPELDVMPPAPAPEEPKQPVEKQEPVAQAPIPETEIAMAPAAGVPTAPPKEEPEKPEPPLAAAAPTPARAPDIGASGGVKKKTPEIGAPLETNVEKSTTPKPGVGGPPAGEMKPQPVRMAALPKTITKAAQQGPAGPRESETAVNTSAAASGPKGPQGAPGSAPLKKSAPKPGAIDLGTGQPAKPGKPGGKGPPAPGPEEEASPRPVYVYETKIVIAMAPTGGKGAGGGEEGGGGARAFEGVGAASSPGGESGAGGPGGQGWGAAKARPGLGGGLGEVGPGAGGGGPGGPAAGPGGEGNAPGGGPGQGAGPVQVTSGGPGGGVGFPGGTGTGVGGEPEGWGLGVPGELFAMAPSGGTGGGFGGNAPGGPNPGSGTPLWKKLPQIGWPFGSPKGERPGPGIPGGQGEGPPASRQTGPINLTGLLAPLAGPVGIAAHKLGEYLMPGGGADGFGGTGVGAGPWGNREIPTGKGVPTGLYTDISGGFDMPIGITPSDYDADASGTRNLMEEIRKRTNLSVTVDERFRELTYDNIKDLPVIHLRGHKAFKLTPEQREALRKYVQNGGTIVGESSHGPFDQCFEREMKQIFEKGFQDLDLDNELYRSYYVLKEYPPGDMGERYPLQGIDTGGRLGVIYSRNDYGDAWEGTGEWLDPKVREPAFQMGVNIYVYIMAHWQRARAKAKP